MSTTNPNPPGQPPTPTQPAPGAITGSTPNPTSAQRVWDRFKAKITGAGAFLAGFVGLQGVGTGIFASTFVHSWNSVISLVDVVIGLGGTVLVFFASPNPPRKFLGLFKAQTLWRWCLIFSLTFSVAIIQFFKQSPLTQPDRLRIDDALNRWIWLLITTTFIMVLGMFFFSRKRREVFIIYIVITSGISLLNFTHLFLTNVRWETLITEAKSVGVIRVAALDSEAAKLDPTLNLGGYNSWLDTEHLCPSQPKTGGDLQVPVSLCWRYLLKDKPTDDDKYKKDQVEILVSFFDKPADATELDDETLTKLRLNDNAFYNFNPIPDLFNGPNELAHSFYETMGFRDKWRFQFNSEQTVPKAQAESLFSALASWYLAMEQINDYEVHYSPRRDEILERVKHLKGNFKLRMEELNKLDNPKPGVAAIQLLINPDDPDCNREPRTNNSCRQPVPQVMQLLGLLLDKRINDVFDTTNRLTDEKHLLDDFNGINNPSITNLLSKGRCNQSITNLNFILADLNYRQGNYSQAVTYYEKFFSEKNCVPGGFYYNFALNRTGRVEAFFQALENYYKGGQLITANFVKQLREKYQIRDDLNPTPNEQFIVENYAQLNSVEYYWLHRSLLDCAYVSYRLPPKDPAKNVEVNDILSLCSKSLGIIWKDEQEKNNLKSFIALPKYQERQDLLYIRAQNFLAKKSFWLEPGMLGVAELQTFDYYSTYAYLKQFSGNEDTYKRWLFCSQMTGPGIATLNQFLYLTPQLQPFVLLDANAELTALFHSPQSLGFRVPKLRNNQVNEYLSFELPSPTSPISEPYKPDVPDIRPYLLNTQPLLKNGDWLQNQQLQVYTDSGGLFQGELLDQPYAWLILDRSISPQNTMRLRLRLADEKEAHEKCGDNFNINSLEREVELQNFGFLPGLSLSSQVSITDTNPAYTFQPITEAGKSNVMALTRIEGVQSDNPALKLMLALPNPLPLNSATNSPDAPSLDYPEAPNHNLQDSKNFPKVNKTVNPAQPGYLGILTACDFDNIIQGDGYSAGPTNFKQIFNNANISNLFKLTNLPIKDGVVPSSLTPVGEWLSARCAATWQQQRRDPDSQGYQVNFWLVYYTVQDAPPNEMETRHPKLENIDIIYPLLLQGAKTRISLNIK